MILTESLWPGMTRGGFGYRTHVPVMPSDIELFPVTKRDMWLPKVEIAKKEIMLARDVIEKVAASERSEHVAPSMAVLAFGAIEVEEQTGCWLSDGLTDEGEQAHTDALWSLAELDMGGEPLDTPDSKVDIRVCDEPNCLSPRHYDFTHRKKYRDRLLVPDYGHYETLETGEIVAIWENATGLVLPSVAQSIGDFRSLQSRCVPYAEKPKDAPLTANGISKITIDSITGCWPVRMYYTRPEDFGNKFQFDGYGRLGVGPGLRGHGVPAYQQLGHRVVARATGTTLRQGDVLNHECGFRPCCNPGHLTQVTQGENILHGRRMSVARRQLAMPDAG